MSITLADIYYSLLMCYLLIYSIIAKSKLQLLLFKTKVDKRLLEILETTYTYLDTRAIQIRALI